MSNSPGSRTYWLAESNWSKPSWSRSSHVKPVVLNTSKGKEEYFKTWLPHCTFVIFRQKWVFQRFIPCPISHLPGTLSNSVSLEQVQLQYLVLFVLLHHPPWPWQHVTNHLPGLQKSISACCFACNSYCKGDLLNPSILRCNSRDIYMSTTLCTSDLCTTHSCIHCKDFWWQETCSESFLFLKLYLLLIRHGSAIMSGADSWRISLNISQQLLHLKEEWVVLTHWLDMFSRDFLPYTFVESRTSLSKSTMRWLNRSVELPPKL